MSSYTCYEHDGSVDGSSNTAPIQTHWLSNFAKLHLTPLFWVFFFLSLSALPSFNYRLQWMWWCWLPVRGPEREHRELGLIAFQTWRNHSWSLTKSRPGDSQLRQRQKEEWAGFKRLLTGGGGGVCAAKSAHCLTLFRFNYKWLLRVKEEGWTVRKDKGESMCTSVISVCVL